MISGIFSVLEGNITVVIKIHAQRPSLIPLIYHALERSDCAYYCTER